MRGHNPIESPSVTRAITARPGRLTPSHPARRRYKFIPDAVRCQRSVTDRGRHDLGGNISHYQPRSARPAAGVAAEASLSPDSIKVALTMSASPTLLPHDDDNADAVSGIISIE